MLLHNDPPPKNSNPPPTRASGGSIESGYWKKQHSQYSPSNKPTQVADGHPRPVLLGNVVSDIVAKLSLRMRGQHDH